MRLLALEKVGVIKPPFHETIEEIVEWVKPATVSVKGSGNICGGVMIHKNLLVTNTLIVEPETKVLFFNQVVVHALHEDYNGDHFLSGYSIPNEFELPPFNCPICRTDDIEQDTYLFSYVHEHGKEYVVRYRAIQPDESLAIAEVRDEKTLTLDLSDRGTTYPLVDLFGFFIGLNLGVMNGEVVCQPVTIKTKL